METMIMTTADTLQIATRIRTSREEKCYSQEYMAAKMGIGQNCYSKIELGKSKLTVERLIIICRLLELDIREIFEQNAKLATVS